MKEDHEFFRDFLIHSGRRYTAVRKRILDVILSYEGDFSVRDLLPLIKVDQVAINRASLYRNLTILKAAGFIEDVPASESLGPGFFRKIQHKGRKSFLFCPGCHSDQEFYDRELDAVLLKLSKRFRLNADSMRIRIEARHLHGNHVVPVLENKA